MINALTDTLRSRQGIYIIVIENPTRSCGSNVSFLARALNRIENSQSSFASQLMQPFIRSDKSWSHPSRNKWVVSEGDRDNRLSVKDPLDFGGDIHADIIERERWRRIK